VSKLTQYQQDALLVLRTRLNAHDPCNTASDEIKAHLRAIDPWLSTWVMTAVDTIDSNCGYEHQWMREATAREAGHIREAQAKLKQNPQVSPAGTDVMNPSTAGRYLNKDILT